MLPPVPGAPSAQKVADRAGVSRSAVSRAFTPGASIAAETRARVLQAAEELGYQVNDLARGLLNRHSHLVGLVVTEPEQGFRAQLVAALTRALIHSGRAPIVVNTGRAAAEIATAQKLILGYRAEGTIVLSGSPPSSMVELARRNGQPLILIGRSESGADHLLTDGRGPARQAYALLRAAGRTRLALAGAATATMSVVEREEAFLAAAAADGLAVAHVRGDNTSHAGGRRAAEALLAAGQPPDGVFCVNDLIAIGLIDRVREAGLDVPGDVAVIGFDDIPEAAWGAYALTTFRQDPARLAAEAIGLLERRREFPQSPPVTVTMEAPLVLRRSTPASP